MKLKVTALDAEVFIRPDESHPYCQPLSTFTW